MQLLVISTHTKGAQCELIKVEPRINLDSLAFQFRHGGTIMSFKKLALIPIFHMVFNLKKAIARVASAVQCSNDCHEFGFSIVRIVTM